MRVPAAPYDPHTHTFGQATFDNTVRQGYAITDPKLQIVSTSPDPTGAIVLDVDGAGPNAGSADSVINPLAGVSTGWTAPSSL